MTMVREDGIENGEKVNFPLRFLCKIQNFINKFQTPLVLSPNAQKFASRFLNLFENY